jgi:hypothetical protein
MSTTYTIKLDSLDLGQLLDGLRCREESWRNTAIYLRDGYFPDDSFVCEVCSDEDEAERIAGYYRRIIEDLEKQMAAQDAAGGVAGGAVLGG